ncbi:unnamed protein product [Ceratitis capitata]|uniref:(Mediterranean fruit fly) hypothetical protein n=1 Tax=Ceratitis capitata TaxID=7213 RepID=A0A811UDC0_CERCA|nr:unnamed protein product [Ceratitis capitata]
MKTFIILFVIALAVVLIDGRKERNGRGPPEDKEELGRKEKPKDNGRQGRGPAEPHPSKKDGGKKAHRMHLAQEFLLGRTQHLTV